MSKGCGPSSMICATGCSAALSSSAAPSVWSMPTRTSEAGGLGKAAGRGLEFRRVLFRSLGHDRAVASHATVAARVEPRRKESDAAIAGAQQMLGHCAAGVELGESDHHVEGLWAQLHDLRDRLLGGAQQLGRSLGLVDADEDESGRRLAEEEADQPLLL